MQKSQPERAVRGVLIRNQSGQAASHPASGEPLAFSGDTNATTNDQNEPDHHPSSSSTQPRQSSRGSGAGRQRRSSRRGGQQSSAEHGSAAFEKDPDYDRSLPLQIVSEEPREHELTPRSGGLGSSGMLSSGELKPLSGSKQLYDPKTDPIPAKPATTAAAAAKSDEQGACAAAGTARRSNRERSSRRSRRREEADLLSKSNPNTLDSPRLTGVKKLFDPETGLGEYEKESASAQRASSASRRRGRERRGRNTAGASTAKAMSAEPARRMIEPVQSPIMAPSTREPKKIMVLQNPNSAAKQSRYPKIASELDYNRETPEEIELKVRHIYSQILYLERKCTTIDGNLAVHVKENASEFGDSLWSDVVRLHEELLEQYDDFMFACRLANATPAILKLPKKYNIPSRMWKIGVSGILDLLRGFLPSSFDVLVSFIYYAYTIMTRLFECMPDGRTTWLEFLGDLAHCRMAIETDPEARQIWQERAFMWYTRCSYLTPGVGRLYHHLAATSEPDAILDQLYYYAKSFNAVSPFFPARESLLALCGTAFDHEERASKRAQVEFTRAHAILFTRTQLQDFQKTVADFLRVVNRPAAWEVDGIKYAVVNIGGLYQLGSKTGALRRFIDFSRLEQQEEEEEDDDDEQRGEGLYGPALSSCESSTEDVLSSFADLRSAVEEVAESESGSDSTVAHSSPSMSAAPLPLNQSLSSSQTSSVSSSPPPRAPQMRLETYLASDLYKAESEALGLAKSLSFSTLKLALTVGTPEHYPHIFAWLVFLYYIKDYKHAWAELFFAHEQTDDDLFPWRELLHFLDTITYLADCNPLYSHETFPNSTPLNYDWAFYGLEWARKFPYKPWTGYSDSEAESSQSDEEDSKREKTSKKKKKKKRETRNVKQTRPGYLARKFFGDDFDYDGAELAVSRHEVGPCKIGYEKGDIAIKNAAGVDRILWMAFNIERESCWFDYDPFQRLFKLSPKFSARLEKSGRMSAHEDIDIPGTRNTFAKERWGKEDI
ncbi:hypothetical protein BZA70DRAFT_268304 [Myxozyma melibiosi]|uniref:DNA/RNA-binding domain-containing protein n=1 Tax=Myxozyma melibiosi TaxID=54550 RepID=A0ABR1F3Q5_9ASCO